MNAHQKYLNHYTQNMKSNNEITKYFLEQEKVSGTIILTSSLNKCNTV